MAKLPRVVLVGRTNVGKSTLFNRLSTEVKSITMDQEGVTRDFMKDIVCWNSACFELVDTGGIQVRKEKDLIEEHISDIAKDQLQKADVILFVTDGTVGVLQDEVQFAKMLHKLEKPVMVLVNKADVKEVEDRIYEFDRLGFSSVRPISAQHGTAVADVLDEVVELLPKKVAEPEIERPLRVALIGKPNVGKSSLLNALIKEERALVADMPGTTREAITEKVSFYQQDIAISDTPGVRRKRGVTEDLERLMVSRSFKALKDADIVLLVVDASQGKLSDQELKLAFYAFEHNKALIILFNKYDLVDEHIQRELDFNLIPYEHLFKKVLTYNISCKTGKNVGKLLSVVKKVGDRYTQTFSNDELTALFKQSLVRRQLFHQGNPLIVYRVKQVRTAPITLVLYANEPDWFGPSQLAYFDGVMRKQYDLVGVPINFIVRKRAS